MAGTKEGGQRAAATNLKRYGKSFYQRIGSQGGKAGTGHSFGHGKLDPHVCGRIGGMNSKRRKQV